jgi:hypothetical protein
MARGVGSTGGRICVAAVGDKIKGSGSIKDCARLGLRPLLEQASSEACDKGTCPMAALVPP